MKISKEPYKNRALSKELYKNRALSQARLDNLGSLQIVRMWVQLENRFKIDTRACPMIQRERARARERDRDADKEWSLLKSVFQTWFNEPTNRCHLIALRYSPIIYIYIPKPFGVLLIKPTYIYIYIYIYI